MSGFSIEYTDTELNSTLKYSINKRWRSSFFALVGTYKIHFYLKRFTGRYRFAQNGLYKQKVLRCLKDYFQLHVFELTHVFL